MRIAFLVCLSFLSLTAAGPAPPPVVTKFLAMFDRLRAAEAQPANARAHVEVAMPESEINEYMQYSLRATPRPGVESVNIKVFPKNYLSTFTVVDFDAIERWKPGTI